MKKTKITKYFSGNQMLVELQNGNVSFGEKIFFLGVVFLPITTEKLPVGYQVDLGWMCLLWLVSLASLGFCIKNKKSIIEEYVCLFAVSVVIIFFIFLPILLIIESFNLPIPQTKIDEFFDLVITFFMTFYPPLILLYHYKKSTAEI